MLKFSIPKEDVRVAMGTGIIKIKKFRNRMFLMIVNGKKCDLIRLILFKSFKIMN
jgi:hypothetical protein